MQVRKNKKDGLVCFHLDLKVVCITLTKIFCLKLVAWSNPHAKEEAEKYLEGRGNGIEE